MTIWDDTGDDDELERGRRQQQRHQLQPQTQTQTPPSSPTPKYGSSRDGNLLFSWRDQDASSFSDWTVEASYEPAFAATTPATTTMRIREYPVHRAVLASGPRACQYFRTLFLLETKDAVFAEYEQGGKSEIQFEHASELDAFELLLDFVYGNRLRVQQELVMILRSVSRYFQCTALSDEVDRLIVRDVQEHPEKALRYMVDADKTAQDDELLGYLARCCAVQILVFSLDDWRLVPIPLLVRVIQAPRLNCGPKKLSRLVHQILLMVLESEDDNDNAKGVSQSALTVNLFISLTNKQRMPVVDDNAAAYFLHLLDTRFSNGSTTTTNNNNNKSDDCNDHDDDNDDESIGALQNLRRRCMASLAASTRRERKPKTTKTAISDQVVVADTEHKKKSKTGHSVGKNKENTTGPCRHKKSPQTVSRASKANRAIPESNQASLYRQMD